MQMRVSALALTAGLFSTSAQAGPHGVSGLTEPPGIAMATWATTAHQVWAYLSTANTVTISTGTCTFTGWDMTAWNFKVTGGTVAFEDTLFSANGGGYRTITQSSGSTLTVDHSSFGGGQQITSVDAFILSNGVLTATFNRFIEAPEDAIDFAGSTFTITDNFFDGGGWMIGGHADHITISNASSGTIARNLFSYVNCGPVPMSSSIFIDPYNGSMAVSGVTVTNNIIVGGAIPFQFRSVEQGTSGNRGSVSNVSVTANLFQTATGYTSPFYSSSATSSQSQAPSGIIASSNNTNLFTGVEVTEMQTGLP